MQASHKVSAVFDDLNLIGSAGLIPVMRLAQRAGLNELLGEYLSVSCPNGPVKAAGVVAGMLAGADSIDDLDILRHGGMAKVFTEVRAPLDVGYVPALVQVRARSPARRRPHPGPCRARDGGAAAADRGRRAGVHRY